ncbi:Aste57867_706 [Aphanomyces stellatus]|uniref:Aste57867_706 protein n=1 Tax=Aphanomyces stellatus TaxID=120398 RepID=A0A485K4G9_9STRA|nr:hypothetical protein As57867_000705 [Aphanomyces stellatus]VFT77930.1 Aste57867_706 [Aphanomyces stellatus]
MDRFGPIAIAASVVVVSLVALTTQSVMPVKHARRKHPCRLTAFAQPALRNSRRRRRACSSVNFDDKALRLAPRRYPLYTISEEDASSAARPAKLSSIDSPSKSNMDIAWNIHMMGMKKAQAMVGDLSVTNLCVAVS